MKPGTREARSSTGTRERRTLDEQRTHILEMVHERLNEVTFAEKLTANKKTGEKHILVALPSDKMRRVLMQAAKCGGSANLFIGLNQDLLGVILRQADEATLQHAQAKGERINTLSLNSTVRDFVDHLQLGRTSIYAFVDHDAQPSGGCAQVVTYDREAA